MNNSKESLYKLTDIHTFKSLIKNYLIEYTNTSHNNYGLVYNILYNEMIDLINNIENVTNSKIIIKDNNIYIVKDCELNFKNINITYPEPVKNAFIKCIKYFLNEEYI